MAEELASLLEKINRDGVQKAEAQREEILAAARREAEEIVNAATAQAEELRRKSESEAAALRERAENAVRQAARDVLLDLENELKRRITAAVNGVAAQALTPEYLAQLVSELAAKFAASPDSGLTVLAAVKDVPALETALRSALRADLAARARVLGDGGISGGLEVSFRDGELYFDFTLEAITELVAAYAGPMISGLLKSGAAK